jgi:pilus assembly protein CpaE
MHAIVACEKQEQRDSYRQILINAGVDCGAGDAVVYADLLQRMNRGGAQLLVVHLGENPQNGLKLIGDAHAKKAMPILAIGPSHDAQTIMEAMNAGAREYVDARLLRENLSRTLEKLRQTGAIQFRRGQSIAVTSALPGSGATTVASGLAFALGALHPNQVMLGEVGVAVPELALDLDLKPTNFVSQLVHDWDRVDASTIRQTAVKHAGGIFVLADSVQSERADFSNGNASRQLVSLIRTMYDFAVYDIGHLSNQAPAEQLARLADRIVLVVRLDVPSLRLTRDLLNHMTDLGIPRERLTLIANRYGQRGEIHWRKMEEALGVSFDIWMPDDPGTVNQALNLGSPIAEISSWSKLVRRMNDLAKQVANVVQP